MKSAVRLALLLLPSAVVGCEGTPPAVPVHPVSGSVSYDGQPAAGVQVFLVPTSAPTVPTVPNNPYGVTGADGKFTLTTYTAGDGAAEGGYQIVLRWPEAVAESEESTKDRLLGWYTAAHTTFSAHIKPGANALPPLNLPARTKPPEAAQGVPGRN